MNDRIMIDKCFIPEENPEHPPARPDPRAALLRGRFASDPLSRR